MRLVLAGCEYSGTTTLAHAIDDWMLEMMGVRFSLIHDHWKLPHTSGHPEADMTPEEQQQVLALSPVLKEMTQRHSLYYHIQVNSWEGPDWMAIGLHVDDTVYGPLYFDYGGVGKPHDRIIVSQQVERSILEFAPDIVIVHVKASPEVIAQRMKDNPRELSPLQEKDIPYILQRFEEQTAASAFRHKMTLDTSNATVAETMKSFASQIEAHLTDTDRSRILTHRVLSKS